VTFLAPPRCARTRRRRSSAAREPRSVNATRRDRRTRCCVETINNRRLVSYKNKDVLKKGTLNYFCCDLER